MATWNGNVVVPGGSGCRIRIETQFAGNNPGGNYSTLNYQVYVDFFNCDAQLDGGWVQSSAGVHYNNGGRVYNYAGNFSNHTITMNTGSFNIGHDANGYGSYGMNAHVAVYQTGTTTASGSEGLPRIGYPPSFSSLIHDTVKPTTARLGAELSSIGRGTSANLIMYIRQQGAGDWTDLGTQGDAAGYNFWYPSGLKPGKVYEYYSYCYNNNGDNAATGVQSFKTQPVAGMVTVMKGIM